MALTWPPDRPGYSGMSVSKKKYTWAQFNVGRRNRGQALVWPNFMEDGIDGVTHRPPNWQAVGPDYPRINARTRNKNRARFDEVVRPPLAQRNAGPLFDAFARTPEIPENFAHRAFNDPQLNDIIEGGHANVEPVSPPVTERTQINSPDGIDRLLDDFDREQAGPSGVKRPHDSGEIGGPPAKMTITRSQGGGSAPMDHSGSGAATTSRQTGHKAGADGGFDSAQGPETMISRGGYSHSGGHKTYTKVHHLKAFAIPFINIVEGSGKYTTTPLAEIPWDKMFFYMSEDEFKLIPAGSHVKSCKISVQNLVSSTQHAVGGAVATTATFNHPKIGVLGFDLEKSSRGGETFGATMSSTKEMIPIALATPDYTDFILKQYGTDQASNTWETDALPGTMFPIPYNLYKYFCVYQPNQATADNQGYTEANAFGYENFNSCITQFNLNDRTWDTIFEREYAFTSAPIGKPFAAVEIKSNEVISSIGSQTSINAQRKLTDYGVTGNPIVTEQFTPSTANKVPLVKYLGPIEQGANMSVGDHARKPARQPTVHFGMKAIPKLSSLTNDTRASEFVHGEVLFVVTATMVVETNSFPNRFIKPKANTVSIENVVCGTGRQSTSGLANVTWGLPATVPYAP